MGEQMQSTRSETVFSPLSRSVSGFPPTLVQVGSDEVLLEDSERLSDRLRDTGSSVQLEVGAGLFHVYQAFAAHLPEANAAIGRIGGFLRGELA
jgi:acetyl esterase/lipase